MKVLYIDGVGPFGGASRSLYELLRGFEKGAIQAHFLVQKGTANAFYREHATDMIAVPGVTRFDNTRASHYRGARWLVVARELGYLPFTFWGVIMAKLRWRRFDLIHVNEIIELFPGILAKLLFKAPMIIHVRSLQWTNTKSRRVRMQHALLRRFADAIITIDENVRATLPDLDVNVIHNSFDPDNMPKSGRGGGVEVPAMRPGSLKVGFIGNLQLMKGVLELLDGAKIVKERGHDVEYLIVGGAATPPKGLRWRLLSLLGLAQEQQEAFLQLMADHGLTEDIHMTGATSDIGRFIDACDVIAFPSHLDACGRPVFEAAFFGKPSIVAVADPRPDTLDNGVTGIAIAKPDPVLIADAITAMAEDRTLAPRMGAAARALAERNFSVAKNAGKVMALYERVSRRSGSDGRRA